MLKKIFRRLSGNNSADIRTKVVHLSPQGKSAGNVLLSYIIEPFLMKKGDPVSNIHTHYWESWQIAQTFLDHGYAVDVIHYENTRFSPSKEYDFFVSARINLETIAKRLNKDCIKIAHLDTAHWLYNNTAAYDRLLSLQSRRGITLKKGVRYVDPNQAIELADLATVLGNQFTMDTYAYAKKPVYHIPISSTSLYPWEEARDFDKIRFNYLWFGSSGFIHKGLDLVLEAFSQMPEYNLTVCGPLDKEKDFVNAFRKELYETPNIKTIGWVDVDSPGFIEIAHNSIGLVYPTCAEGGGGSAITCMHAAIIPILSHEASVDIGDSGFILKGSSIEEIKNTVKKVSALDAGELKRLSRNAWELARQNHTRDIFKREYEKFVSRVLLRKA